MALLRSSSSVSKKSRPGVKVRRSNSTLKPPACMRGPDVGEDSKSSLSSRSTSFRPNRPDSPNGYGVSRKRSMTSKRRVGLKDATNTTTPLQYRSTASLGRANSQSSLMSFSSRRSRSTRSSRSSRSNSSASSASSRSSGSSGSDSSSVGGVQPFVSEDRSVSIEIALHGAPNQPAPGMNTNNNYNNNYNNNQFANNNPDMNTNNYYNNNQTANNNPGINNTNNNYNNMNANPYPANPMNSYYNQNVPNNTYTNYPNNTNNNYPTNNNNSRSTAANFNYNNSNHNNNTTNNNNNNNNKMHPRFANDATPYAVPSNGCYPSTMKAPQPWAPPAGQQGGGGGGWNSMYQPPQATQGAPLNPSSFYLDRQRRLSDQGQ